MMMIVTNAAILRIAANLYMIERSWFLGIGHIYMCLLHNTRFHVGWT